MALHERIVVRVGSIGIRAELNAAGAYAEHPSRVLRAFFQRKSELLAKEELRSKGIPEGVYRKQFLHVPRVALPPSQFPQATSCKADAKLLPSPPGEARWNDCFVTRESV
jgi:hypothetical protein